MKTCFKLNCLNYQTLFATLYAYLNPIRLLDFQIMQPCTLISPYTVIRHWRVLNFIVSVTKQAKNCPKIDQKTYHFNFTSFGWDLKIAKKLVKSPFYHKWVIYDRKVQFKKLVKWPFYHQWVIYDRKVRFANFSIGFELQSVTSRNFGKWQQCFFTAEHLGSDT